MNNEQILKNAIAWDRAVDDIVERRVLDETIKDARKQAVHELNKYVFDLAEKNEISVWEIVANFVPVLEDFTLNEEQARDPNRVTVSGTFSIGLKMIEPIPDND